jgi:uncharacterized iron-regulated membrane protein
MALLDVFTAVVLNSGLYLWLKRRNISFEAQFSAERLSDRRRRNADRRLTTGGFRVKCC